MVVVFTTTTFLRVIMKSFRQILPVVSIIALASFLLPFATIPMEAARVKDIAVVEGVSGIQLIGYGLVTGLNNTGDTQQSLFTNQTTLNLLKRFGITVEQRTNLRTRNVAAVMVTATVHNFSRKGMKFDVQVSSMGDSRSLQGGILLMTPLSSGDGTVYAMAQGGVSVGGYDFGLNESRVTKNFVSSGRVPNGGIIDRSIEAAIVDNQQIRIALREPDFTTVTRVSSAINRLPNLNNAATPINAGTVEIALPSGTDNGQLMSLIAQIEALTVDVDPVARVVINERTGTVVVGAAVELLPVVVAHGGLEIQVQTETQVAVPAPFTVAQPQTYENSYLNVAEEYNQAVVLDKITTVQDMASALNSLKVSPRDLIAIFQALKESGSLQAELVIQ
jgi:flagellar P-ring protein precursor FlgI